MIKWIIILLLFLPILSWADGDTLQVSASADDAEAYGTQVYLTLTGDYIGRGATGTSYYSAWRFLSSPVPQGAVIDSAILIIYADSTLSGTNCNVRFQFEDTANPATYITGTAGLVDWNLRSLTTAYTDSTIGGWTTGTSYRIVVTSGYQEVVNRADYAQGYAVACQARDNSSSTNAKRRIESVDKAAGHAAQLYVYWKPTTVIGILHSPSGRMNLHGARLQ